MIDVEGSVVAFKHGLVFPKGDIQRLIGINRDFIEWQKEIPPLGPG